MPETPAFAPPAPKTGTGISNVTKRLAELLVNPGATEATLSTEGLERKSASRAMYPAKLAAEVAALKIGSSASPALTIINTSGVKRPSASTP